MKRDIPDLNTAERISSDNEAVFLLSCRRQALFGRALELLPIEADR